MLETRVHFAVLAAFVLTALLVDAAITGASAQIAFQDVSVAAGFANTNTETWGASWGDLDGDHYPDLPVAEDLIKQLEGVLIELLEGWISIDALERMYDAVEEGRFIASRRTARAATKAEEVSGPPVLTPEQEARRAEEQAEARGRAGRLRVLAARGGELEQEFPFGVVRQLFELPLAEAAGAQRSDLLEGAAGVAARLLELPGAQVGGREMAVGPEPPFAVLHGLYWLCANLAAAGPLCLVVDDAHWADGPSLRYLAFLLTRLDELDVICAVLGCDVSELLLAEPETVPQPKPGSEQATAAGETRHATPRPRGGRSLPPR